MEFCVDSLPLAVAGEGADVRTTGVLKTDGEYAVVLRARNAEGQAEKKFKISAETSTALTPPMGWNSWNRWAEAVDQERCSVQRTSRRLRAGRHGWTYVNIHDTWQGQRSNQLLRCSPTRDSRT